MSIPRLVRVRNLARVALNGRYVYLGRWDDPTLHDRYDRTIAAWLERGRTPDSPVRLRTVSDLAGRYAAHAKGVYQKAGRSTGTHRTIERLATLLTLSGAGETAIGAFGPAHLRAFRTWLCNDPAGRWSRRSINDYAAWTIRMFKWGASHGIIPSSQWLDLASIDGLRADRPPEPGARPPREGREVQPVPQNQVDAALRHAHPMLAAMIRVQLLTGMRPRELVLMRSTDVKATDRQGVHAYHVSPEANKTYHAGKARTVYIGPRAMKVLRPWLDASSGYVFDPRRAAEDHYATLRERRTLPLWPSHSPSARKRRRGSTSFRRVLGDHYTVNSYRRAIERACDRACDAAGLEGAARWRWSPGRLRHSAATYIAGHEDVHVAQFILGHARISTTLRYVKVQEHRAIAAAKKLS
jgi:integrase